MANGLADYNLYGNSWGWTYDPSNNFNAIYQSQPNAGNAPSGNVFVMSPNPAEVDSGFLGLSGRTWGGIGAGLQGLGALASAFMGLKNYKLAKKQFAFQKALANRNLANQAQVVNNAYDNAAQVAAGLIGGKDAYGNYGFTDQSLVDRYAKKAEEKHVDGSAIG